MVEKDRLHSYEFRGLLGLTRFGDMGLLCGSFVREIFYQWLYVHSFFSEPLAAGDFLFSVLVSGGKAILDDA